MMRLIQMVLLLTGLLMVGHVQEKMTGVSRRPRSAPARLGDG